MEPSQASIQTTACAFRQVRWSFPSVECQRCGRPAPRLWDATRVAIDIDLDQPVVLAVQVSVHVCPVCGRMFRAQPPFLRPRAIYTQRVVQKAVEAVYRDGMAMRCVPDLLARDVWVKPDEKMIRLWCRAFAAQIDFVVDYQAWVVANFSGILCVDEVYQGDLALLLAIDPAAPDGDRLVGYTLLPKTREVNQTMVKAFLERLRAAGLQPDEVITDDSRLYPSVLAEVWPTARHQLYLFHATRRVVRAARCRQAGSSHVADGTTGQPADLAWHASSDASSTRQHDQLPNAIGNAQMSIADQARDSAVRRLTHGRVDLRTMWPTLDVEKQRGLIESVLDHIVVNRVGQGRYRDSSRLAPPGGSS